MCLRVMNVLRNHVGPAVKPRRDAAPRTDYRRQREATGPDGLMTGPAAGTAGSNGGPHCEVPRDAQAIGVDAVWARIRF